MSGHTPFGVSDTHTVVGLALRNLDLLASEQTRIHRTAAGSEHRERGAQRAETDECPRVRRM